jgi:HK97 family phage major capsid protein
MQIEPGLYRIGRSDLGGTVRIKKQSVSNLPTGLKPIEPIKKELVSAFRSETAGSRGLVENNILIEGDDMNLKNALAEKRQEIASYVAEVDEISARLERENRAETPEELFRLKAITNSGGLLDVLGAEYKEMEEKFSMLERAKARVSPRLDAQIAESEGRSIVTASTQTKKSVFASQQAAHDAGMFYASALFGNRKAERYCESHGLISNAMTEGNDLRGGAVVPEVLESTIVELREQFGVFRQESTVVPMSSDSHIMPKVVGELTSYYVSEMGAITPSDMTLTQIRLTAKKLATLTAVSSELDEDAVVSMAEMLTRSIAYSFALEEDKAGFIGDSTITYGGISGLNTLLAAGSTVTATSRQTFGVLTMADFEGCIGRVKQWAGSSPKWYISQAGWANSMQRLLNAAGGNDLALLAMGPTKMFMGYPVVISQVLPQALTGTTGTLACFFGDLRQGVYMGSRRGVNVQVDPSLYFNQDALAVRATQRYDINIHDRGDASNAGGIVKLVFG